MIYVENSYEIVYFPKYFPWILKRIKTRKFKISEISEKQLIFVGREFRWKKIWFNKQKVPQFTEKAL